MSEEERERIINEAFKVMAKASIGNLEARVNLPDNSDESDLVVRFAMALNVLLDDLEQNNDQRVRELAEAAISQSIETNGVVLQAMEMLKKADEKLKKRKSAD